jgi:hypothetical protein
MRKQFSNQGYSTTCMLYARGFCTAAWTVTCKLKGTGRLLEYFQLPQTEVEPRTTCLLTETPFFFAHRNCHSAGREIPLPPAFQGTRRFITVFTRFSCKLSPFKRPCFNNSQVGFVRSARHPTPNLKDHSLSAVTNCLFSTFTVTLRV